MVLFFFFFQAEDGIRDAQESRGLGDVYKRQIKEIKFGPNTEEHDYNFKKNNAIRFLKQRNKVKFTVRFRGRQMAHKELGYDVLERLKNDLGHIADVDAPPVAERNLLFIIMTPKKDIDHILEKAAAESAAAPETEANPVK